MANGGLAQMSSAPKMALTIVATIDGSAGTPAPFRTAGFSTTVYDMVTCLVAPALTLRDQAVRACSKPKKLESALDK
jgi:hypothetical protein